MYAYEMIVSAVSSVTALDNLPWAGYTRPSSRPVSQEALSVRFVAIKATFVLHKHLVTSD